MTIPTYLERARAKQKLARRITVPAKASPKDPTLRARWPADKELREQRRAICNACPHLKRGPVDRCGQCGCLIIGKISLTGATCPIHKW